MDWTRVGIAAMGKDQNSLSATSILKAIQEYDRQHVVTYHQHESTHCPNCGHDPAFPLPKPWVPKPWDAVVAKDGINVLLVTAIGPQGVWFSSVTTKGLNCRTSDYQPYNPDKEG